MMSATPTDRLSKIGEITKKYTSCRWILSYVAFVHRTTFVVVPWGISVAIVCMNGGNDANETTEHKFNMTDISTNDYGNNATKSESTGEFNWTPQLEGWILSAYHYGFIVTPIIAGFVADRFSVKRIQMLSLTFIGVLTVITPFLVKINVIFLLVIRILLGLILGTQLPVIQALWSRWAPQEERSQLTTVAESGVAVGTVLMFLVSGYMCAIPVQNGWPFIFYIYGVFCLLNIPLWYVYIYDSPDVHPRISDEEKEYLSNCVKVKAKAEYTFLSVPWTRMLTSTCVWAILIAQIGVSWIIGILMSYLPSYMEQVLLYDIKKDSFVSCLPFVGEFFVSIVAAYIADYLNEKKLMEMVNIRKLFQVPGSWIAGGSLIATGYLTRDQREIAVALLFVSFTFLSLTNVGFRINQLDIAPRYAGILKGASLVVGMATTIIVQVSTGYITENTMAYDPSLERARRARSNKR